MRVLLVAGLVLATGCTGGHREVPASAPGAAVSEVAQPSGPSPTKAARSTAREIVEDPHSRLYAVDVTRSGRSFHVTSMWSLDRRRSRRYALAESNDGFRTGRYVVGGTRRLQKAVQPPRPTGVGRYAPCSQAVGSVDLCFDYSKSRARWTDDGGRTWSSARVDLSRLLPWPIDSLAPDVFAVAAGGDGATLFPFQRVVVSPDGGASWQRFDVSPFEGEMAYSSGHVVTSDGRLVALLDHFSDDRPNRPSERHHGLWSSEGTNWSSYRPLSPRMTPPLEASPSGWAGIVSIGASAGADPLIWVTTWDHRLYVSTDDVRTFQEIPAR